MKKMKLDGRAFVQKQAKAGKEYTGVAPINVDNVKDEINIDLTNIASKTDVDRKADKTYLDANFLNKTTKSAQGVYSTINFHKGMTLQNNKITQLGAGTNSTDAVNFGQLSDYVTTSFGNAFYFNKGTSTPEKVLNKTLFTKGAQMNGQSITGLARGVSPTDAPNYAQVNEVRTLTGINKDAITKNTLDLATISANLIITNTAVSKNSDDIADTNITLGAVVPLVTKNSQDINKLKTEQGTQNVKISTNENNIKQLTEQNKSQLNWTGNYDSSKTYMKNDVVTSTILAYISEIDNNKEPLTDSTAWFQFTPSVDVDLSKYYSKIETNDLLQPLEVRLTNIETFDEVVEGELAAVKQVLTLKTNNTDFNPVAQKVNILFPAQIEQVEKDIVVLQAGKTDKSYVDGEVAKVKRIADTNTASIETNTASIETNTTALTTKTDKTYVDSEIEQVETSIQGNRTLINDNIDAIGTKQNTLIAGTNITIVGDTINSTASGGGGGYPLALLLSPNQTANNNAATQQAFTLPEAVNLYQRFSVVMRDFTSQGLFTITMINDEKSFGQAGNWFLYGERGPSTLKWVNVSGGGTTGVIWLYTNAAILFIYGEKATTPLRTLNWRADATEWGV